MVLKNPFQNVSMLTLMIFVKMKLRLKEGSVYIVGNSYPMMKKCYNSCIKHKDKNTESQIWKLEKVVPTLSIKVFLIQRD